MQWGAKTLPKVVLTAIDGGTSRTGRLLLIALGVLLVLLTTLFFATADPMESKLRTLPWLLGGFGLVLGCAAWMATAHRRAHRSALARLLLRAPGSITAVREEVVAPRPGGVQRSTFLFDGCAELAPRRTVGANMVVFRMRPCSWVYLKVEGKLLRRRLVVPFEDGPALLSYLFAVLAQANPRCDWGGQPIESLSAVSER